MVLTGLRATFAASWLLALDPWRERSWSADLGAFIRTSGGRRVSV